MVRAFLEIALQAIIFGLDLWKNGVSTDPEKRKGNNGR